VTTVSVIIVSFNTRQMTLDCLRALDDALAADGLASAAEVLVVDNGSTDGSAAAVREAFPDVVLIENQTNRGFSAANNQAIRVAKGERVLLLNSDAFPRAGAIAALMRYLDEHPRVAAVGPRLLNADGSLQPSCFRFAGPWRSVCENLLLSAAFPNSRLVGDFRAWPHDAERDDVDFVIGACMLVRRAAIEQVGVFDEAFFLYF
jgi:GT2 family glycosyltransferase